MPNKFMENGIPAKKTAIINDFAVTLSTINGSGSATANMTLARALFLMGIPVSAKNIFPSNIQGLPTWFTIRCSPFGYLGRVEEDDIVVTMNPATFEDELKHVIYGGVILYADDLKKPEGREDVILYPMPVKKIVQETDISPQLKGYIANMVYVGVLAELLGIDLNMIYQALEYHFENNHKAITSNFQVIQSAVTWTKANLQKNDPYFVEALPMNTNKIMANGNTAAALGSIYGGVQFVSWYPITPASGIPEDMNIYLPKLRKDPLTGKETYVVVQAEDELSAIGMVTGAGWAGLRSMTATSGPGLSLMSEYLGLAYFAEVPLVLWDVQRVGPSTGLPTRTSQGDLSSAQYISHGDTEFIILLPGSIEECFEFGWRSFDIAERLQTPVIVLSDLDLGMNHWISEPFKYPEKPIDRGKILWEKDLDKWAEMKKQDWGRFVDVDGDGITYRTVPGNLHPKAAYFMRGTGHNEYGGYSEDPQQWEKLVKRLKQKFITARLLGILPEPKIEVNQDSEIGFILWGSTELAVKEARAILMAQGISTDCCRVRSLPLDDAIGDFIEKHKVNYVVELNRDGQLHQLLIIKFPEFARHLISLAHLDGLPVTAKWIIREFRIAKEK
jgi:2-oxoglutarate/2-oxoacid ferredoxin oxidoreductase subunit alpha